MNTVANQFLIVFIAILAFGAGPAIAIGFLVARKLHLRMRRRSPLTTNLLRQPGHTLRAEIDDVTLDLFADVLALGYGPLMVLVIVLLQEVVIGVQIGLGVGLATAVLIILICLVVFAKLWKKGTHLDQLATGYEAEVAAGQELEQLRAPHTKVFHDFPADDFNIDHVLICSKGVFAIETKGFAKPKRGMGKRDASVAFTGRELRFPTWTTTEPLTQAQRQATWLSEWLTQAIGFKVGVTPVLALPGWWVERTGVGPVRVLSGRELYSLLQGTEKSALSEQDCRRIASQVEQRCRTVAPRY